MEKSKINFETCWKKGRWVYSIDETHLGSTPEETFKNALNSLPKHISKAWESITFDFEDETIKVLKEWLNKTGWDFESSVIITQSNHKNVIL